MAGENLRAHDAWLPLQGPNEAAGVALSSQADMESVEGLKRPVRLLPADAQPDPPQCNIITRFLHTSRDRALTTARQLLYPDTLESVHVCGRWRGGEVASLPGGNPPCSGLPTQAGSGAEVTPYPASLPGNFPPGTPPGPVRWGEKCY